MEANASPKFILFPAVSELAQAVWDFSDADLGQPYAWLQHDEGVRLALLGTHQDLLECAVKIRAKRRQQGVPQTAVQQILAQNHAGFRDLQAVFLGISPAEFTQEPAPGEWPLRRIFDHIIRAERWFYTLVWNGLVHKRANEAPVPLPETAAADFFETDERSEELLRDGSLPEILSYYENLHFRSWDDFAAISDEELDAPTPVWWEGEIYSLHYRLHRFDAHLRQHLIQAEKTIALLGKRLTEAQRLVRLLYATLAECEGLQIGRSGLEESHQLSLAGDIQERRRAVSHIVHQARDLETAINTGDLTAVKNQLTAEPTLANALSQGELPLIMTAVYRHQPEIVNAFREAGAGLSFLTSAAVGDLARTETLFDAWPAWLDEYSRDGFTPLHLACYFNQEAVALFLIDAGADINAQAKNDFKITALHAAAAAGNIRILQALLAKGADLNRQQQGDFTVLHEAAHANNVEMIELFLKNGADPMLQNDKGQTPLALARAEGHSAAVAALEKVD